MKEVWNDPQVKYRNMRVKLKHEKIGETDNIGVIPKFSEKPSSLRTPSPLLGEHSEKILLEHGYSKEEINQFIKNKFEEVFELLREKGCTDYNGYRTFWHYGAFWKVD